PRCLHPAFPTRRSSDLYGLEIADQPVLAIDRVRYQGEPVAVLAANDLELARRATEQITVAYEVLPAVTDMEQALRSDAPRVHDLDRKSTRLNSSHQIIS